MNLRRTVSLASLCGLVALAFLASACGSDPVDEGTAAPEATADPTPVVDGSSATAVDGPREAAPPSVAAELIVGEWRDDGPKRSFGWPFLKLRADGTYKLDSASACGSTKGKWVMGEGETLQLQPVGSGFANRDCVGHHWSIELEEGKPVVAFSENDILFKDGDGNDLGSMERIGLEGNRSDLITPSEVLGSWTSDSNDGFHSFTLRDGGKASGSLTCNSWHGKWWVDYAEPEQPRELHFEIGSITMGLCLDESEGITTPFVIDGRPVARDEDGEEAFRYRRVKGATAVRGYPGG